VIQFGRTATRSYELRGKTIRQGETACLFYPSANRDEEVFADGNAPDRCRASSHFLSSCSRRLCAKDQ
jgi:cytochrome P450